MMYHCHLLILFHVWFTMWTVCLLHLYSKIITWHIHVSKENWRVLCEKCVMNCKKQTKNCNIEYNLKSSHWTAVHVGFSSLTFYSVLSVAQFWNSLPVLERNRSCNDVTLLCIYMSGIQTTHIWLYLSLDLKICLLHAN